MADNTYSIEIKPVSKNGYFTPAESRSYYGKYSRDVYIVHWWGNGAGASGHDGIVNYITGTAAAGNMSVNYVLSDNKITLLVNPDNVSWGAQSGNSTGINVEHQPTLNAEGYKKSGWLKEQLEQRYNKRLSIKGHNAYFSTACPGTVSLDRIEQECDKWRRKVYDQPSVPTPAPTPTPTPKPPTADVVINKWAKPERKYTLNNAKLVDMKTLQVIKTFPLDTPIEIAANASYNGKDFFVSVYAYEKNTKQGFLFGDLKDSITAPPVPTTPPPTPVPPTAPDYVTNLRDIDDTEFWLKEDAYLIDITTGELAVGSKDTHTLLKKDSSFVASAVTASKGVEYRITDYSFKKGIYNGIPTSKLTLTKPGVPDIPPVPSTGEPDRNAVMAFLTLLRDMITEFLSKYKK